MVCKALFVLWLISLFVSSASAFQVNPNLRTWLDHFAQGTRQGLMELAETSTEAALKTLTRYFGGFAVAMFVLFTVGGERLGDPWRQMVALSAMVLGYSALCLNAWNLSKAAMLKQYLSTLKSEALKYSKRFALFAPILLVATLYVAAAAGELDGHTLRILLALWGMSFFAVVLVPAVGSSIAYAVVVAPPMFALAYVWLSIQAARVALNVGSKWLVNVIVLYMIVATAFFTAAGFPVLKAWLGIGSICG